MVCAPLQGDATLALTKAASAGLRAVSALSGDPRGTSLIGLAPQNPAELPGEYLGQRRTTPYLELLG